MKRIVLLALLALALPMAAFADSIDFNNIGGTVVGTTSGLTVTANLTGVSGLAGLGLVQGADLGTITISLPTALTMNTLQNGGMISAAGSSFTITSLGSDGLPSGTLFTGTFTGPVTWSQTLLGTGDYQYSLKCEMGCTVSGTLYNGTKVVGTAYQFTVNTGQGLFNGKLGISSGDLGVSSVVPEPGTLALLGTGLVGLAGTLRRKLKS